MSAPYIPRTGTLPEKVCSYFMRLPEEELLTREIAANYGALPGNVALQLKLAVEAGYLTLDGSVYSAGPKLGELVQHIKALGDSRPVDGDAPLDLAGQGTPRASAGFHAWLDKKGQQSAEGRSTKPGKPAAGSPPPRCPESAPPRPCQAVLHGLVGGGHRLGRSASWSTLGTHGMDADPRSPGCGRQLRASCRSAVLNQLGGHQVQESHRPQVHAARRSEWHPFVED